MAEGFLRRWFGGGASASPSVEEARAEIDCLIASRPAFLPLLRWLRELLPDLAPAVSPIPSLSADQVKPRLAAGIPLLRGEKLHLETREFRRRWRRACDALEAVQPDGAAAALAEAVRRGRLDPSALVEVIVTGRPEMFHDQATSLGLDPGLATTLLRFTLFPLLVPIEMALAPLRVGTVWQRGYCPTCGSWPLLGEFRGLDQSRFLRCGLCAAGWAVPRLWCPFCGNRDHETLQFLHAEGEETKYRALVCDGCRGYVKMLTTLSALPPLALLVADAATVHLDLAAAQHGYLNPPPQETSGG